MLELIWGKFRVEFERYENVILSINLYGICCACCIAVIVEGFSIGSPNNCSEVRTPAEAYCLHNVIYILKVG